MTESCEVLGEGEAGAGRPPYLPLLPTRCPEPSLGHNHCDSALAKMHRLVEVTVSAYFDINVNVSPTVSQPVCVCVCPAVSALSRSLLEVSMGPGRCCQTSHCGSSLALGVVLSQILAPHLIPAFPHSIWGWFCLVFLLSPCRSRCCTQTCELQVKGTGLFWPSTGHRLVLDSRVIYLKWPWNKQGMTSPRNPAHSHPARGGSGSIRAEESAGILLLFPHVCP